MRVCLKILKRFVFLFFWLYALICFLLYIFQEKLLFFPSSPYLPHYQKITANPELQNYTLHTPDGYILDGWAQKNPKNQKTILYFGGNGDETSYFVEKTRYENINIISFNYRGYARSTGKPSEKILFADSLLIADFLENTLKIFPKDTFIMGRSLGTGVATYLASQKTFAGVILITPYDSVESVASEWYWFVPIHFLIRNRFLSTQYAQIQKNQLLTIYWWMDTTIPNWHTEKLLSVWKGSIKKVFIPDAWHENILEFSETKKGIEGFVR